MTRVLSGAALLVVAAAVVWLAPTFLFVVVAEGLLLLAFSEYAALARAAGTPVPDTMSGAAAALVAASFARNPFGAIPWMSLDAVLMASLVVLSMATLMRWNEELDALSLSSAALLPTLYLGLPIGAMIATRDTFGREGLAL